MGRVRHAAGPAEGRREGGQPLVGVGVVGRLPAQVGNDLRLAAADLGEQDRQRLRGGVGTAAQPLLDEGVGLLDRECVGLRVRRRRDGLEEDRDEGGQREQGKEEGSFQLVPPSGRDS
ncbi:MAG TPA: hypothetical protein VIO86_01110 [Candidatus Dormibacteraeota bacterium]|jgi:hypothetical protein